MADIVAELARPLLIALDVDGVLAPIVSHPDHAALSAGLRDVLQELAAHPDVRVAVVSGRTVADLARFDFTRDIELVGSHGMETEHRELAPLDGAEHERLETLRQLAVQAADGAGEERGVEHKPASVVLHVRQVPDDRARTALDQLRTAAATWRARPPRTARVLELFTRREQGRCAAQLRSEVAAASTVFVGDDVTDRTVSSRSTHRRAHQGRSRRPIARHRLHDTDAVAHWLRRLAEKLSAH